MTFSWTDIEDIAIALVEAHPGVNPQETRFTQMREWVERLEGFRAEVGQTVNEQILEAVQIAWEDERSDLADGDDDGPRYTPNNPFRSE